MRPCSFLEFYVYYCTIGREHGVLPNRQSLEIGMFASFFSFFLSTLLSQIRVDTGEGQTDSQRAYAV